jgi:integrase
MTVALPQGMFRHPKTGMLWARKDVPKALRPIVGKTSLKVTLKTKDLLQARAQFHDVMQRFEHELAAARLALRGSNPPQFHFLYPGELPQDAMLLWSHKPEHRMEAIANRMDRRLQEVGLVKAEPLSISMHELFQRWNTERKPARLSYLEYERAKDQFLQLNGDVPISEYTVEHARSWKDHVLTMRTRNGASLAHGSQVKIFGIVRTLFNYADRNGFLITDPFQKINLEKPKRPKKSERQDWDEDELQQWFSSPIYTHGERPRGGAGEAAFWLPILALFHGLRAGELCQLDRQDVMKRNGIWCLRMAPSDEDEDGLGKSIKNDKSIRFVPLHARVLALGFLEYLETITHKKLFPAMAPDAMGRWAGNYSKWFGRYRKKLGLRERFKDFHSFRHTWKTHARGAHIPEDIHDEISGHESGSVGRSYGKYPIPLLKQFVDKVVINVQIPTWRAR